MSLRTFHLLFISLSVVMCVASGLLIGLLAPGEAWAMPGIAASVIAGLGLVVYGRYFLRRYRNILPRS